MAAELSYELDAVASERRSRWSWRRSASDSPNEIWVVDKLTGRVLSKVAAQGDTPSQMKRDLLAMTAEEFAAKWIT